MTAGRRWFAVIRVRGAAWDPARPMREQAGWPEHASFMNGLATAGFVVLGGPLGDGTRVLHIVEAPSENTVREGFSADPWEKAGLLRTARVEAWTVLLDRNAATQPAAE